MPIIVIPTRLASTRLPNKLLLDETGKPLICHTIDRALESKLAERIIVASEDQEILDAIDEVKMSGDQQILDYRWRVIKILTPKCVSGTERVSWAVANAKIHDDERENVDIVINLQGDEPELPGSYLDDLIVSLRDDATSDVATLAAPASNLDYKAYSVVKVVLDHNHNAMYFSRACIPHEANRGVRYDPLNKGNALKHVGVYAYKREFMLVLDSMEPTTLGCESLEQLQWLQSGFRIKVLVKDIEATGIDTQGEYENFVKRWQSEPRKRFQNQKN